MKKKIIFLSLNLLAAFNLKVVSISEMRIAEKGQVEIDKQDLAKKVEETRKAKEAEEAKKVEEAKKAEEAKRTEEARKTEEAKANKVVEEMWAKNEEKVLAQQREKSGTDQIYTNAETFIKNAKYVEAIDTIIKALNRLDGKWSELRTEFINKLNQTVPLMDFFANISTNLSVEGIPLFEENLENVIESGKHILPSDILWKISKVLLKNYLINIHLQGVEEKLDSFYDKMKISVGGAEKMIESVLPIFVEINEPMNYPAKLKLANKILEDAKFIGKGSLIANKLGQEYLNEGNILVQETQKEKLNVYYEEDDVSKLNNALELYKNAERFFREAFKIDKKETYRKDLQNVQKILQNTQEEILKRALRIPLTLEESKIEKFVENLFANKAFAASFVKNISTTALLIDLQIASADLISQNKDFASNLKLLNLGENRLTGWEKFKLRVRIFWRSLFIKEKPKRLMKAMTELVSAMPYTKAEQEEVRNQLQRNPGIVPFLGNDEMRVPASAEQIKKVSQQALMEDFVNH